MSAPASVEVIARDGAARVATVRLPAGSFTTPCFMPVGTRASVKALDSADVEGAGAEVLLANAYHLMLRPGAAVVAAAGGVGEFSAWRGLTLTDSGGYQAYSLGAPVDDDGINFRSVYDGSRARLTPESAVEVQEQLGADIQMVLDVCAPWPSPVQELRSAVERTDAWARRAKRAHRRSDQALFGIVQGGCDLALRRESAERSATTGFDGYGIGGLSVGEPREEMLAALAAAIAALPEDRPRYLMGVGDAVGIVEAVALGVDMFDCVAPTRAARHGTILTDAGRFSLRRAAWAGDTAPLEEGCACPTCSRYSRAYLRHLLVVREPSALRLLSIHNLAWVFRLLDRVRAAVRANALDGLRREVAATWGGDGI